MKIAFFDLDGTLTHHDTFIEFAIFSVGRKAFLLALLKSLTSLVLWKLGFRDNSYAKQVLFFNLYRGWDYSAFKELGQKYAHNIDKDIREEIIDILNCHKRHNHKIVLVSASIGDWIRPWAQQHGISEVIATEIEVEETGRITGYFSTRNCYGKEKENRIRKLIPQIDDYESWAYGDSSGDNAMLALVDHPNRVASESKSLRDEIVRFSITGIIAVAIQYGLYLMLLSAINMKVVMATIISYTLSFTANYFLSNFFTFRTRPCRKNAILFLACHFFNLCLQTFLVAVFSRFINPEYALIPALIVCVPCNFILVRLVLKSAQ